VIIGSVDNDYKICVNFADTLLKLGLVWTNGDTFTFDYNSTHIDICNLHRLYWAKYREDNDEVGD